ncbi:hypothetical protein F5X96DRAFT_694050 [Biscogniauxia mediterranea]|nr:hypothetical protein F5X96DRAFT_694050 [Biscogniauxia mediterranea]
MPPFGRIGKNSNRSQHNLVEQQQQQQLQLQQLQQLRQQQQQQQGVPGGSGGGAVPPLSQSASLTSGGGAAIAAGAGGSSSVSLSSSSGPSATTQGAGSSRRVSAAADPNNINGNNNSPSASSGPPSLPLPPLPPSSASSSQTQVQAQAQVPPQPPPPGLSSSDSFHQQQQQQFQQQQQHQRLPQHLVAHSQQQQQQRAQGQPLEVFGTNTANPSISPNLSPAAQKQQQLQHHQQQQPNSIPLNLNQATYTSAPQSPPPQQQQQQQPQQPRDNFAELVSRSQSARYSQHITTLQTFSVESNSVDDLPHTAAAHVPSPIVSQGGGAPPPPPPPSLPHSQTAPTETKRSTRKLIKNILSGSSSRPTSDHYTQDPSFDNSGLTRRPSKRASNPPTTKNPLLRSIDHPDWVPPPAPFGARHHQSHHSQSHSQSHHSHQHQQQHHHQHQHQHQQLQNQPSPGRGVGETDAPPYSLNQSNQDLIAQDSQEAIQQQQQNTIRHVPAEVDSTPYEELAFHQQQAIAHHQAQILQAQQQAQAEQQQQLYGQAIVDPSQSQSHSQSQNQNQYQYPPTHAHTPHEQQYQTENRPPPYAGHLSREGSRTTPNPETISQISHESPDTDSEHLPANSHSAQDPSAARHSHNDPQTPSKPQISPQPTLTPAQTMAPPGGPSQSRRSGDNDKHMRSVEPPPGPPPGYRHSQGPMNSLNPLPPTPGAPNSQPNFRASGVQDRPQFDGAGTDAGRNSPQPSSSEPAPDPEKQFKDLLTKYKNVKRLYFDGKTQIEQLGSQVEQLQNAVANQRMSQSRTALDDNEYSTRFNRLNGAINNLAFNIRKDWRTLPEWIERFVTPEAIKTGKQEMTAVGRAVIVRWIVEEIFNKCFHPGLDVNLSCHLKEIERNIRRFSYTMTSQEEYDALTAKVLNWRMATLEGLQHMLNSPESSEYRNDFTKMATSNLTATLYQYLTDPPPAGVDGSASMIVELAVGIAANLPLESRDVALTYPLPGDPIQPDIMELEKSGLPPLPDPVEETEDNSTKETDKAAKREKTKSGMLTMLGSTPNPGSRKGSTVSLLTDTATTAVPPPPKDPSRVRFAGFIGVEVRGRQVLMKAPVWALG